MARLFITPREIDLISDLSKEIIKDVVGQKIYYFPINAIKTAVHDVYEEAARKVFDSPIEIEALVEYIPEDATTNYFGNEEVSRIHVFIQKRDLIDKKIKLFEGDFFSYGTQFFEVLTIQTTKVVYGQIEHPVGVKIVGREAREGQFRSKLFGPTNEIYTDPDAVQKTFAQQRGFSKNQLGETNDMRTLQQNGVLTMPISGPAEVAPAGSPGIKDSSAFYDES